MTLAELNAVGRDEAIDALRRCCGSTEWAARMAAARPFGNVDAVLLMAQVVGSALREADWREAFAAHPKIGEDERPVGERWSAQEQSGVATASAAVLDRLAAKNREYQTRFGYIFIVCATGKTADEMLAMLERRLTNDPATEICTAAGEQVKITQVRLRKLLADAVER